MANEVTLSNGQRMPQVALGTSRISAENLDVSIKLALDMGYRHIDTAFFYGNERAIGKALQEYFETSNLKREELFITTKLLPNYMAGSAVGPALDESLRRLRLDYVDLFHIHFPCAMKEIEGYPDKGVYNEEFMTVDLRETWKAMEETVYKGKARSIGVCNFNSKQLDYILEFANIPPVVNQVFTKNYMNSDIQSADNLVENPVVIDIAQKNKCTPGQVLLRNLVQRGIAVVPKSENSKRMKENLQICSFTLSDDDMKIIGKLDNGGRRFFFQWCNEHPEYPFDEEF